MSPQVSIVIPNHDYGRYLDACLDSLAAQTLPVQRMEVIVVDDASGDDSLERAARWQACHPWKAFTVVPLSRVGRPGPVRNAGLRRAQAALMLCLDPDDTLAPEALVRMVEALDNAPHAHVASSDYFEHRGEHIRRVNIPDDDSNVLPTQNPCHSASLFRREVWEATGGYTAATAYEDWDFWVRAASCGMRRVRVPYPLVHYRLRDDGFWAGASADDAKAKAAIVRRTPAFFAPEVRGWAVAILRGETWMPAFPRGVIPTAEALRAFRDDCMARLGPQADSLFTALPGWPRKTGESSRSGETGQSG